MNTYPWWPILYICLLFLMAYSVHIPPHVGLFSISTTYSWPNFYRSDFYGLFSIFIYLFWAYFCIFYSCMCLSLLERYFMTTYLLLMTYFVYLLLLGGLIFAYFIAACACLYLRDNLWQYTFSWWPILYISCTILYIYFSLLGLFLHFLAGYVHVFLVMYSVHIPAMVTYSVRRNFLKAYSVHIPSHVWLFSTRTASSILFIFFFSVSLN